MYNYREHVSVYSVDVVNKDNAYQGKHNPKEIFIFASDARSQHISTSNPAAMVSAAASLAFAINPGIQPKDVIRLIEQTSTKNISNNYEIKILNIDNLVKACKD